MTPVKDFVIGIAQNTGKAGDIIEIKRVSKRCPDCSKPFIMETPKQRRCEPCRIKHNKETHVSNYRKHHTHNDNTEMLSIGEARVNIGRTED